MKIGYYSGKDKKNNVSWFLKEHSENHPDKVVFSYLQIGGSDDDTRYASMTYSKLDELTARVAKGLKSSGIKEGDRVLVFVPMSPELYINIISLQRIGAIPVFLDSWSRKEQLVECVKNSEPIGIITISKALEIFRELFESFNIHTQIVVDKKESCIQFSDLVQFPESQEVLPVNHDHTALITYTTGSSGKPKGANRTHRFLAAQHYELRKLFPYLSEDIDLPVFPVFALNNIGTGITTVIPAIDISTPSEKDAEILLAQIENRDVSCMTLSPSAFKNIYTHCMQNKIKLHSIRRVLTGGAPISETDIKSFVSIAPNSEVWILYGSTEVEPIAHIEAKEMLATNPILEGKNITEVGVNVGRIVDDLQYKFLKIHKGPIELSDRKLEEFEVGDGEIGELIVSGEHVCAGYYKNTDAFLRTKIKDEKGVIWHRTGDLARIDSTGYLWIVGRVHNLVERGEAYFFPVRPEIILKDLPYVANAAFLEVSTSQENKICAVVTPNNLELLRDKNVQRDYRDEIFNSFKKEGIPLDEVVFFEDIPMDVRHHSKVDYGELRKKLNEYVFK